MAGSGLAEVGTFSDVCGGGDERVGETVHLGVPQLVPGVGGRRVTLCLAGQVDSLSLLDIDRVWLKDNGWTI